MAATRIFSHNVSAKLRKTMSTVSSNTSARSPVSSSNNASPSSLITDDVMSDVDFLSAKDSVSEDSIDWNFGRHETEEFVSRPKGRHALPLVHHHGFVCEIPPKHRFVMGKFDGLYNYLMMDRVVLPEQVS